MFCQEPDSIVDSQTFLRMMRLSGQTLIPPPPVGKRRSLERFVRELQKNPYVETLSEKQRWFLYRGVYILLDKYGDAVKLVCVWVEPEHRKQGKLGTALSILKGVARRIECDILCFPVPFRFRRDLDSVDWDKPVTPLVVEDEHDRIRRFEPTWETLRDMYLRHGFVERPDYCGNSLSPFSKSIGRYPLVYEGSQRNEE